MTDVLTSTQVYTSTETVETTKVWVSTETIDHVRVYTEVYETNSFPADIDD